MGFGPPCRYELSFATGAIGVDNGDLDAVHEADGVDPYLIILKAIIDPLTRSTVGPSKILAASWKAIPCRRTLARFLSGSQVNRTFYLYIMYLHFQGIYPI
jgi:hypothetical protein